jgi:hypothetical protein
LIQSKNKENINGIGKRELKKQIISNKSFIQNNREEWKKEMKKATSMYSQDVVRM